MKNWISVAMQKQILELLNQGKSVRAIARILKKNRRTVARIVERGDIKEVCIDLPDWAKRIDWEKINLAISQGVQMNILAAEHAKGEISYSQFRRQFNKIYPKHPTVTMRIEHNPAEKCFFDYAEGIDIVNRESGEIRKTQLLCGVMAMSSYTFGEFTMTQKREDLMRSMENAFRFFGGVTPYVTVDNQRAVVDRADWYDPDVNPAFVDFANHWGFAVIPARPFKPRDKGANESGIGVIQRQFYQEVREKTFYSLAELNQSFSEYLKRLNTAVMKDWGVSRLERFAGEKEKLLVNPNENWEPREWRKAKVHADCHVQVAKKFYSVPYQNVGREVQVRISSKLVEIFDGDLKPLACHVKLYGATLYSTDPRHYPEEKLAVLQFSVQQAKKDAGLVGPETSKLIDDLLEGSHPLRYLRRVQGVLRLYQSKRVTREGLEHGAKMARTFNKRQLQYIKYTAEHFDKNGSKPRLVSSSPVRELSSVHLHKPTKEKRDDS